MKKEWTRPRLYMKIFSYTLNHLVEIGRIEIVWYNDFKEKEMLIGKAIDWEELIK